MDRRSLLKMTARAAAGAAAGTAAIAGAAAGGLNSEMWAYQMVPFTAEGTRCIAFDRRGHGRSSDPGRGYAYDTLADDLAAVIEALDLRNVTLVGHSMGCGEIVGTSLVTEAAGSGASR